MVTYTRVRRARGAPPAEDLIPALRVGGRSRKTGIGMDHSKSGVRSSSCTAGAPPAEDLTPAP